MTAPDPQKSNPGNRHHDQPHADHEPKREKRYDDRRLVARRVSIQTDFLRSPVTRGDEAAELRYFDREEVAVPPRIGNCDQHFTGRLLRLPSCLDCSEFGGLVLQDIEASKMAKYHLHRNEYGD